MLCLPLLVGYDRLVGITHVDDIPLDAPDDVPCFVDMFDGEQLDARWALYNDTNTNLVVRQQGALEFHYAEGAPHMSYNNITAVEAHDMGQGYLMAEMVAPPTLHRETGMKLALSQTEFFSFGLRFDIAASPVPRLVARQGADFIFNRPYDPVADRWLRIRFEDVWVTYETSPDATTWTGETVMVNLSSQAASVVFDAYVPVNATVADPANVARWDNISLRASDCAR